jgi:rfaE bifunctional protein nucleotidyltransferase chain/domain
VKGALGSLREVVREARGLRARAPGFRVVLANGIFDLPHVGHLRYLRAARGCGDWLVVAVNDDRSARRLKGPGRPVQKAAERASLVAAVRGVDRVVLFSGRTVGTVIRRLRPDIHCKGTDYTAQTVPERALVAAYGGRVRIAGDPKRHSSTAVLERMSRTR